jgi:hypothetical protein
MRISVAREVRDVMEFLPAYIAYLLQSHMHVHVCSEIGYLKPGKIKVRLKQAFSQYSTRQRSRTRHWTHEEIYLEKRPIALIALVRTLLQVHTSGMYAELECRSERFTALRTSMGAAFGGDDVVLLQRTGRRKFRLAGTAHQGIRRGITLGLPIVLTRNVIVSNCF